MKGLVGSIAPPLRPASLATSPSGGEERHRGLHEVHKQVLRPRPPFLPRLRGRWHGEAVTETETETASQIFKTTINPITSRVALLPPRGGGGSQRLTEGGLRWFLLPLLLLIFLTPAHANTPDERLADPALEERARQLSKGLRCVVCQNQSIDDSDAGMARDMRLLVRERLEAGDTDEEVRGYLVDRFGEFVLLRPRFGAHTALLWATPVLLLFAGGGWLLLRRRSPDGRTEPAERLSEAEERELERIARS